MSVDFRIIDHNFIFQSNVTLTPSTQSTLFPVSNLKHYFRSKVWRSTTTSSQLVIDLKTEEEIDTFAMVFDPVELNKFSQLATIKLQASATDLWTSPVVDVLLNINEENESVIHTFDSPQAYRYWRVTFSDPGNPYGYIECHKLFLGKSLSLTRVPQIGFGFTYEDQSIKDKTIFGHEYVDVLPIIKNLDLELIHLNNLECEELWKSFLRTGSVQPILVILDADEELFNKHRHTIYGKYPSDQRLTHVVRDRFNYSFVIKESF